MIADVIHDDTGLPRRAVPAAGGVPGGNGPGQRAVLAVGVAARSPQEQAAALVSRAGLARHPRLPAHRRTLSRTAFAGATPDSPGQPREGADGGQDRRAARHPRAGRRHHESPRTSSRTRRRPWPPASRSPSPTPRAADRGAGGQARLRRDRRRRRGPGGFPLLTGDGTVGPGPSRVVRTPDMIDSGCPPRVRHEQGGARELVLRHRDGHHHRGARQVRRPRQTGTTSRSG